MKKLCVYFFPKYGRYYINNINVSGEQMYARFKGGLIVRHSLVVGNLHSFIGVNFNNKTRAVLTNNRHDPDTVSLKQYYSRFKDETVD